MEKNKIFLKGTPPVTLIHALASCAQISPVESVIKICVKALINLALCPTNVSLKCMFSKCLTS